MWEQPEAWTAAVRDFLEGSKLALEEGARTRDIGGRLRTTEMGDAVLKGL